ncbi:hypothetical protein NQ318_002517 [Aromia moschata]|uniref:Uncharacterized protein n=1 Tax=Aromia moschata TaxID=1265417 RepID=A0AAV8Y7L6_9CUCU|nr:hypothetical protein NQ318_002517 [Aromia moschata]
MDLAKSLFETRNHEGYVGKDAHTMKKMVLNKIQTNFLVYHLLKILSIVVTGLQWVAHLEFSHNKEVSGFNLGIKLKLDFQEQINFSQWYNQGFHIH